MKALSFLGLGAVIILFATTWCLSYQDCYNWGCECSYSILNHDVYIVISLGFSIFFLLFCTLFLFKFSELSSIQKTTSYDKLLDSTLVDTNYTVYQLPSVRLFSKIGFALSLGLFLLAYATLKIQCLPDADCNLSNCTDDAYYGVDTYLLGYGISGMYFTMFSFIALLKAYPSKYV